MSVSFDSTITVLPNAPNTMLVTHVHVSGGGCRRFTGRVSDDCTTSRTAGVCPPTSAHTIAIEHGKCHGPCVVNAAGLQGVALC